MAGKKYKAFFYTSERGRAPVLDFLKKLDDIARAKVYVFISRLEQEGPNLQRPFADQVRGKIRELRIPQFGNQYRIFYFFFTGDRVILLHAITKKAQQLRAADIELAEARMLD